MEQALDAPSQPIEDQPKPEIPTSDDPKVFFSAFKESEFYSKSYSERLQKLSPSPDVTEQEQVAAFDETEVAKIAMLDFAQKEMHFKFNSKNFDDDTIEAIDDYVYTVKHHKKILTKHDVMGGGGREADKEAIMEADRYRSRMHDKVAEVLKEKGYVSSDKLGRTMARLILIDVGLDNYDNAGLNDYERLRKLIAG